jgi:hypothetical protein
MSNRCLILVAHIRIQGVSWFKGYWNEAALGVTVVKQKLSTVLLFTYCTPEHLQEVEVFVGTILQNLRLLQIEAMHQLIMICIHSRRDKKL